MKCLRSQGSIDRIIKVDDGADKNRLEDLVMRGGASDLSRVKEENERQNRETLEFLDHTDTS